MKRVFSLFLSVVLLLGLLPAAVFAAENITVTVTMDTQAVAEDVSNYALTALPAAAEVSVPKGSTVNDVLSRWAADQSVSIVVEESSYGPYLTTIGGFGSYGTTAFDTMCANAGYEPMANDIFQYAGWVYSIDSVSGLGIGSDTVSGGETIAFRYGLYMASGIWEQVDHAFLDAYNELAALIEDANAAQENDFTEAQWQTLQTALTAAKGEKTAVDEEAYGMWLSYFAAKQTLLWGPGSPTDKLQKAALALENALSKVVTPSTLTFVENDVEIPVNKTYTIPYTVGPEGAAQDVTHEVFLGDGAFTVSDTGVITPSAMNSLCWVKVACKDAPSVFAYFRFKVVAADSSAEAAALLENIAASYVDASGEWVVMDMAAYEDVVPAAVSKTSENAKKTYINSAITALSAGNVGETAYAKTILALQSIGADPQTIYPRGSGTSISAVEGLASLPTHGSSAWVAPYTLAALNQGDYGTDALEQEIIASVLANQGADGSWNEWGDTIQTTANVIAGLSFYYGTDAAVTAALDKAVAYLSSAQKANGTFDAYGSGADANTAAMVVVALAALGIDPDEDARFVKGGVSALDALLAFGLADGSAFGYTNNTDANAGATEQGFRALVAAKAVMSSGAAFNVYDFSANAVTPARCTTSHSGGGSSRPSGSGSKITVSFELKTHEEVWIAAHNVSVSKGASVGDLFEQVLDADDAFSYVNNSGYVSSITKGETTLAAFDLGRNSGWKYQVNGAASAVGMNDKTLASGDEVVWYYVVDYTQDTGRDDQTGGSADGEPSEESAGPAFPDIALHANRDAIEALAQRGVINGKDSGLFDPDATMTRAEFCTIVVKALGLSAKTTDAFSDVSDGAWFAPYVGAAYESGVVNGTGGGRFTPNGIITRQEAACMLARAAALMGMNTHLSETGERNVLAQFSDYMTAASWARSALAFCYGADILDQSAAEIKPGESVTRGEVAQMIFNLLFAAGRL